MDREITTKSGAVYRITADGFWSKNNGSPQPTVFARGLSPEQLRSNRQLEGLDPDGIKVGNHLYISGYDLWWLSTPIVSVEEY